MSRPFSGKGNDSSFALSKFLNIPVFVISVFIGFIVVYIYMSTETRRITVYPTPENIEVIQYKDTNDNCFRFEKEEVDCNKNNERFSILPQI